MKIENGKLIVAEGEVTGHAHRISGNFELAADGGSFALMEPTPIEHEEHGPINLPAKEFCSGICLEQDHFAEEARNVAD